MNGLPRFLAFLLFAGQVLGSPEPARTGVGFASERDRSFSGQQFSYEFWKGRSGNPLLDKRFHFEDWGLHFSRLGAMRTPVEVLDDLEGNRFPTPEKTFPTIPRELSRWDAEIADVHRRAGISMDARARSIAGLRAYRQAIESAESFPATGQLLSLRDINRYQFRRNRPEGEVPVERAGGAE